MKHIAFFLIIMSGAFALNYHGVALAPDNTYGWAVCIDTVLILHTIDGGATWQTQTVPPGTKRFFDVGCVDQMAAWTVGLLGEILHTENSGLDWYNQAIGLSKYGTRIEFIDDTLGWATCGDGTVGKCTDGGGVHINELHMGIRTKTAGTWNNPVEIKAYFSGTNTTCWDTVSIDTSANTADSIQIFFCFNDFGTHGFYTGIDNISVFATTARNTESPTRQSWDFEDGWQGWTHTNGQPFPAGWDVQPASLHTPPPDPGDSVLWIDSYAAGSGITIKDTVWSPSFAPVPGDTQKIRWSLSIHSEGIFWDQIFTPWYSAEFYGVSFVNQWDGWVVAGFPDSIFMGQGLILKSTDGGINWDSVYQVSAFEDFFDVHFFNLLDGIVIGGDEVDHSPIIMKTTDGGQNWNNITAPASAYYLRAVDFVGSEGWAVGMNGTIIHTTDGGDTWTFQTNPATNTLFDVDFSDNLHGLACGHNHLMYTTDGGQNWHDVGILEENGNAYLLSEYIALDIFPNPSRKNTNIKLQIPNECQNPNVQIPITLKIFDVSGRLIKNLKLPTPYSLLPTLVSWDGTDENGCRVANGIYFISCEINNKKMVKKAILIK